MTKFLKQLFGICDHEWKIVDTEVRKIPTCPDCEYYTLNTSHFDKSSQIQYARCSVFQLYCSSINGDLNCSVFRPEKWHKKEIHQCKHCLETREVFYK